MTNLYLFYYPINFFVKIFNFSNANIVVIDWIRRIEDIEHIKDLAGFVLIYVESDVNIRFDRTKNRWENIDERNLTIERFIENSKAETETKIRDLKNI